MTWLKPVTLKGTHVTLVPLLSAHHDDLAEAVRDGELWKLWFTSVPTPDGMRSEIERRLGLLAKDEMLPFTVFQNATGKPVGMTSFANVNSANRHVEIGFTWYRRSAQRTPVNTESKLLLLAHAFESLDCVVVEFRTHFFNHASRRAIERLGAKLDGVLRNNHIMPNGTLRDTCAYSIIASEWPTVKVHLSALLDAK